MSKVEENKNVKKTTPKLTFHKGASLGRFTYKGLEYVGKDLTPKQKAFLKKEGIISINGD